MPTSFKFGSLVMCNACCLPIALSSSKPFRQYPLHLNPNDTQGLNLVVLPILTGAVLVHSSPTTPPYLRKQHFGFLGRVAARRLNSLP